MSLKQRMRLARKTLMLSCLIPAVLARDCLVVIKDRPVSSSGVFVFEFLGASFSRFEWFVFEIKVLRFRGLGALCFGFCFRVLCFRNYQLMSP